MGKKVKALRRDNGGEYVSNEFKKFCALEGIRWELITPHNPHENGVAQKEEPNYYGSSTIDVA